MSSSLFRGVIMGAPGSGKGTISARILKNFKIMHISTGDILRKNMEQKTRLGIEAEKFINQGKLLPDHRMMAAVVNELERYGHTSWMLDGFPRTKVQADKLWNLKRIDGVINLIVPYKVILDRVAGRWIHLKSGRVYNTDFNPPKVAFKDDVTGEDLEQRPDDNPDLILKRLKIYDEETKPVIAFYKAKGLLVDFEGETSDIIWPKVKSYLGIKLDY